MRLHPIALDLRQAIPGLVKTGSTRGRIDAADITRGQHELHLPFVIGIHVLKLEGLGRHAEQHRHDGDAGDDGGVADECAAVTKCMHGHVPHWRCSVRVLPCLV